MTPMSVESMLQIGYGCGLNTVDEAYSSVMMHYDCFFSIEKFAEEHLLFRDKLHDAKLLKCYMGQCEVVNETIVDAAKRLGIVLKEIEDYPPQQPFSEEETFDIVHFEE